EVTSII
nr:Chain D, C-terminal ILE-ILE [Homo sapiens]